MKQNLQILAIASLLLCIPVAAQDSGRLGGTVADSTGAAIPGVTVVVTNLGTNAARSFKTNEQGRFTVGDLLPGEYRVSAEATGFKRFVQIGVQVRVGDIVELSVKMEVGTATESITVDEAAPLLESTNSALGEVIERKLIANLPMNERQPLSLVLLSPGVTPNRQINNAAQPFNRAGNFSVGGGRGGTNEILMDGTPNTVAEGSTGAFRAVTIFPTVEGTQEIRVQTNTYTAEFGGSGGGVVNIVTKSGTNRYHGAVFEFLRNSKMDANGFFSNARSIPLASFKRNQFGAAFGGPVSIPKIYDGRNKTFVFGSWETLKELGGIPFTTSVPTARQKAGDYSQTLDPQGRPVVIYDPATTTLNAATGQYTRQPFPGNVIVPGRINPIAAKMMSLFPTPTDSGLPFTQASNFNTTYVRRIADHRLDVRLDQNLGDKHRIYWNYALGRRTFELPNIYGNASDPNFRIYPSNPTSVKLGYLYSISPSWAAEFRYAYNHLYFAQRPGSLGYDIAELGFPKYVVDRVQTKEFPRLTFSDLTGTLAGMGHTSNNQTGDQNSNIFVVSLSRVSGNHAIKFGTQVRRDYANRLVIPPGDLGFVFSRTFTQGPNALAASTVAGNSIASALLGIADTATGSRLALATPRQTHSWWHSYYVQDDWRVNRRLTLNLGLRWDLQFPMVSAGNNMNWFDPDARSPIADRVPSLPLKGAVIFASDSKRNTWQRNNRDFAPRIGLAYKLDDRTVIRSGYGLFYSAHPYGTSDNVGVGFSQSTPFISTVDGARPIGTISDPFPNGFVLPFGMGATPNAGANLGLAMNFFEPQAKTPSLQQWNLSMQRQIGKSTLVEARYTGMKGSHLPDIGYFLSQLRADQLGPQVTQPVSNPFAGIVTIGTLAQPTVRAGQLMNPFPQYASALVQFPTAASSIYHSLQLKTEKRFSSGLTLLLGYTFSKLIDDNSGTMSWLEPATGHQDGYNRRADRSISDQDVSRRMVTSFAYELPFGKGKKLSGPSYVNAVLGGWQVSGIITLQTGIPLALLTTDTSNSGNGGVLRPNNNGKSALLTGSDVSRLRRYFATDVFSQPPPHTFGNVSRTLPDVRGPGFRNLDMSLLKDMQFREGVHLQLRGEAFNLGNTPEFDNPNTNLQNPNFGTITAQRNQPRQIQVSLRLSF